MGELYVQLTTALIGYATFCQMKVTLILFSIQILMFQSQPLP